MCRHEIKKEEVFLSSFIFTFLFADFLFAYLYILFNQSLFMRIRRPPTMRGVLGKELHCSKRRIKVGDEHLDPVSSAQMSDFLLYDKTDELKWKEGVQDCDNFALYFRANAKKWFERQDINASVGTIWTYKTWTEVAHAFNFYLKPNMRVIFIEPQTDQERFLNARVNFVIL